MLSGIGIGEAGAELLVDCGASSIFMDSTFQMWAPDYQFIGGTATTKIDPVGGTPDEDLYKSYRTGSAFQYALDVPDGVYDVTLHFVEFAAVAPGNRLMDISAEGVLVLDDLDIFAQVGADVAYQESFSATVSDGVLDLDFQAVAGNSIVSAIEARMQFAELEITPTLAHDFTFVDQGSTSVLNLMAENTGTTQIDVSSVDFNVNSGAGHELLLDMDGNVYMGDEESINLPATLSLAPGATAPLDITFQPTDHGSAQ